MPTPRINPSAAALWASAFVVAAFVIVQAGRLPGNPAYAEMVGQRGDYTVLTTTTGRGSGAGNLKEVVYVIDSRDQVMLLYEIEDARAKTVILRDGGSLERLFNVARQ